MSDTAEKIDVNQLQVGMHIELPSSWTAHPFLFNKFKIKSTEQVEIIQQLGLEYVLYHPKKSDSQPLPSPVGPTPVAPASDAAEALRDELARKKNERIESLKKYRRSLQKTEKEFENTFKQIKNVMSKMASRPLNAITEATELVNTISDAILGADNLVLHLMNEEGAGENLYYHSLNVTILSIMLAKVHGFSVNETRSLGLGAMFHDVGKLKIPAKVLRKKEPLTGPEAKLLELHTKYGVDLLKITKEFPEWILPIIMQHHEHLDGSGYPMRLKGNKINRLAQIVAVVNTYDNLCHPMDPGKGRTPYSALSYLYKEMKGKLNEDDIKLLVKLLGVYPPGSVVGLSDGRMGLVMSVNANRLLFPRVLVYDPSIPRNEAAIIDLEEDGITIKKVFKPSQLKQEALEYLCPRAQLSYVYYFDEAG